MVYGRGWRHAPFREYIDPENPSLIAALPPCFLVTARGDFLRHYSRDFAAALKKNGLEAELLDMDGNVLVVRVQERPTVANIHTTGISEFDAKGVEKSLRDVGLAEGFIFDRAVLDRAVQELRRQYLSRGRYSADVKVTVTPRPHQHRR